MHRCPSLILPKDRRDMHLRLIFGGFQHIPFQRLILSLLSITITCVVSPVDSQFDVIAKKSLFIDRSLLVEKLFSKLRIIGPWKPWKPWIVDHHTIIGPRKSGKSTNLSMMKQFFGVCVDESGKVQAPNTTKYYTLFKNLKIGQRPFFEHHFARFPVIHINLAEFVVNGSERDCIRSFCKVIRGLVTEHEYLLRSKAVDGYSKNEMKIFSDPNKCERQKMRDLEYFGNELVGIMHHHFDVRVLVLIDKIDAPAMSILDPNVTLDSRFFHERFIDAVFRFVTYILEDNGENVIGSFLTGATNQGVILGDFVSDSYALDQELKNFYGVTEEEVRMLLSKSGIPLTTHLMKDLRETYGGYGITDSKSKDTVYNTQSIIKYCEGKVIKPYWDAAPGIVPFTQLFFPNNYGKDYGRVLESAMYGTVKMQAIYDLSIGDLLELKHCLTNNDTLYLARQDRFSLVGYLFESGLFNDCSNNSSYLDRSWSVKVPNNENRLIMMELVLNKDYYMAKHGVNATLVDDFVASVVNLDANETSFEWLVDCTLRLFAESSSTKNLDNEALFRYPLYSYLHHADNDLFSDVNAELGQKTERKNDIIVTRKDGTTITFGLTLDEVSGEAALKQALGNEKLNPADSQLKGKLIFLGINLKRSEQKCDMSYIYGSHNISEAKHLTRSCNSGQ